MSDTLNRLIGIVGKENVVENPEFTSGSAGYRAMKKPMAPDFLVKPSDSNQVQQLVKLANDISAPVIPVSSAAPHRTGGVMPDAPGAIVIDLSGMKKIQGIDKRYSIAMIEPGVTWEELADALAAEGMRIPQPLLPKKGKSVVATLLDREPLLSPKFQYNMTEPLRSMEIIFGNGEKMLTGMAGHKDNDKEKWDGGEVPLTNVGPGQFDFMKMTTASQGTFGIVTWASVKIELAAREEKAIFTGAGKMEDLTAFMYKNLKFRFGDEVCLFNRKALAAIIADNSDEVESCEKDIPMWTAFTNVKWGALRAEEKVRGQSADIADIAQENGLIVQPSVGKFPADKVTGRILSIGEGSSWKDRISGESKEIFFLTTLDRVQSQLEKAAEKAAEYGYNFSDCPVYVQPLHQGTAAHCHIVLPLTGAANEAELYRELCVALKGQGAFYSRPYGEWASLAYDSNTENTVLVKKMKAIFDPNNILNPGKLCF